MKEIQLTNGGVTTVDDADYLRLSQWKWRRASAGRTFYAVRSEQLPDGRGTTIMMHRVILGLTPEDKIEVDHRNSDGLNNQRSNVRLANHKQNSWNRRKNKNNTSGYTGVVWDRGRSKWWARIKIDNRLKHIGRFDDAESAGKAYAAVAQRLRGDFARTEVQCG